MLQKQQPNERRSLLLVGFPVCQRSFRILLGVAKSRLQRLRRALVSGLPDAPNDGRRVPKAHTAPPRTMALRAKIHEWLEQIYHTMAEPLPEAMTVNLQSGGSGSQPMKKRGKRPRHRVKRDEKEAVPGDQLRFLPPGTIMSYYELFKLDHPGTASRKLFTRDSCP